MPLVQTRGAASAQGFGEFAQQTAVNYIEDVFSTYLWDGNSTARNIVNGIDLATKGGMVWAKYRNATNSHRLYDTNRGATKQIFSDLTNAEQVAAQSLTAFNTDGFSLGTGQPNENTATVVGWTFRKQAKFFDVVTYTGNGTAGRTVSHNLGSTPGMIIIKRTNTGGVSSTWSVYHRSTGNDAYLTLNSNDAVVTGNSDRWNNTNPTSTQFTVGTDASVNQNNSTYVAYLFAHNAGGFGTSGTDNVISCGSYTTDGSGNATVNLGYEPQYVISKVISNAANWIVTDVMRGAPADGNENDLQPNTSSSEFAIGANTGYFCPTATGFNVKNLGGVFTVVYMAIRRPMKVPTTGTSVFSPIVSSAAVNTKLTTGFPVDLQMVGITTSTDSSRFATMDRLRGVSTDATETSGQFLVTFNTNAENTASPYRSLFLDNTGFRMPSWYENASTTFYNFSRRPGFFDEVCYTGTGSATTQAHNLTVSPELIIVKCRNSASPEWTIYNQTLGNGKYLFFNDTAAGIYNMWNATSPTSSVFSVSSYSYVNGSGNTYVAYLFATCPGVSKVGSYTGNGGTQAISCGFTGGARFVLIKRTDDTGNWYVYDTARGMTTLTDPYLLMNSTAGQVATLGSVTTTTGGFTVNATILAAINTNAASYIFLAIA